MLVLIALKRHCRSVQYSNFGNSSAERKKKIGSVEQEKGGRMKWQLFPLKVHFYFLYIEA